MKHFSLVVSKALTVPSNELVNRTPSLPGTNNNAVTLEVWLYDSTDSFVASNRAIHIYELVSHRRTAPDTDPVAMRLEDEAAAVVS